MPIQKMLNILKILFAALSAMFLFLYLSLMQRHTNAVNEIVTRNVRDADSLLNQVSLSPTMALIPMIVCIIFTAFLFVMGAKEKKNLEISTTLKQPTDAQNEIKENTEEIVEKPLNDNTPKAPMENISADEEQN